ncbi:hypothetical protein NL676_019220 [Syzygium grande]|nr:hypothetical protein NL676_019220 [Syzygium grande]
MFHNCALRPKKQADVIFHASLQSGIRWRVTLVGSQRAAQRELLTPARVTIAGPGEGVRADLGQGRSLLAPG